MSIRSTRKPPCNSAGTCSAQLPPSEASEWVMQTVGASSVPGPKIIGDAASLQRQQHGALLPEWRAADRARRELTGARPAVMTAAIAASAAPSRASSAAGSPATCTLLLRLLAPATIARSRRASPIPPREAATAPRWRGRPRAARRPTLSKPASRPRDARRLRSGRPARAGSAAPPPARRPVPPSAAARRNPHKKAGARSYRISRRRNISSRIRITGEISTPPKLGRNERIGRNSGSVTR